MYENDAATMSFYEQLSYIGAIFDNWTPCERTVVLCALFRRVPWYSLKLLHRSIDNALQLQTSPETDKLESEANDAVIITQTAKTTDDNEQPVDMGEKISKLLVYLPLLEPNNARVKEAYLTSVPPIIQMAVDGNVYLHECQQYLSYMLIHPGLDANDRRSLAQWLRYLENHLTTLNTREMRRDSSPNEINFGSAGNISNGTNGSNGNLSNGTNGSTGNLSNDGGNPVISNSAIPTNSSNGAFRRTIGKNIETKSDPESISSSSTSSLQESFTKNGKELDLSLEGESSEPPMQPKPRSNSLTPPMPSYIHMSSSAENLNKDEYFVQKPRSFSLSSEHMAQLKPLLTTTGSETRLDALKANKFGDHPGMSTVAQWLKSLRLHKYVWLFSNISYEQMMAMDEEYLQKLGVTKGARHKLLLCITKLHERDSLLEAMYRELKAGTPAPPAVVQMLEHLREVLVSPIQPASSLSEKLVKVLELASTRLLSGAPAHPPLPAFPAYNHQADDHSYDHPVAGYDPVSMHCWLIDRALHHPSFNWNRELVETLKKLRYRLPPRQFFSHLSDLPFTKRTTKPRWRCQGTSSKPQSTISKRNNPNWLPIPTHSKYGPPTPAPTPQRDPRSHPNYKSSSYPSFPPAALGHKSADSSPRLTQHASISLGDINSRLESLCLQMTEKAMN